MGVRAGSLKHNRGDGVFQLIAVTHLDYIIGDFPFDFCVGIHSLA